ncbi:MAG: hypothetical protein IVW56_10480, partial [Candidatus Binataceae bacterium]|nr:hypothetical protein [Candidatus Binataceae bacterium]
MEHSLTDGSVLVTAAETGGDAGEWIDVDSLALGCENIGGMVVQSAHMRRVLKTIAR